MLIRITLALMLCIFWLPLIGQSNFDIAFEFLEKNEAYTSTDLADVIVSDEYQSRKSNTTHIYLQQRFEGKKIIGAISNFNIRNGELLRAKGSFERDIANRINASSADLTAENALRSVILAHQLSTQTPRIVRQDNTSESLTIFDKGDIASENINVRLVYIEDSLSTLRLVWEVDLYEKSAHNAWLSYIDVQTGEILQEYNQVINCSFHNHKTKNRKNTVKHLAEISLIKNAVLVNDSYRVFAAPVESPSHGSRTLEISPWDDAGDAGTLGWHDDGTTNYTHTRGNNVDAYEDQNNSNSPTGGNSARANGGSNLEFDFPLDLSMDPELDPDPYITNLFYWNNLMHDVWYQYGFDEPSGNFQEDNQGRGGSGDDYVRAEAQDGGGTNNANFFTPSDGNRPRMQMYLWAPAGDSIEVNSPGNVAGLYEMRPGNFGGSLDDPITGDVVEVDDGGSNPSQGCSALVNAAEVSGKVALIDRGGCQFGTKALNAENAGAIAVIICNNEPGLLNMGGGNDGDQVTIPAIMIRQGDCTTIRAELDNGLNVTLLDTDNPPLDGDLDNGIICHEYGHGISIRLTGGPSQTGCLNNAEQMGEGWSDFFGIWMTTETGNNHYDVRGVGTYALGESPEDDGIRPAPYTTDMVINPYTYGNVDDSGISQPHGIGFIWCTMIWDLNWAFINRYGYSSDLYFGSGGNNEAAQLIMDGLKGQPCDPGFVDGRDAILDADEDNNGGANQDIIWNVFARRGLGFSADQGSAANRSDQTEAFDLPPEIDLMTDEELFGALPLPVDLTRFQAFPNHEDQQIELYWTTASENENAGFAIERSEANATNFSRIGWIQGRGDAQSFSDYTYLDRQVEPGVSYYYRLKQIDFSENSEYSEVVQANLNGKGSDISIFPNPTKGISTIECSDDLKGMIQLNIFNAKGQLVGNQVFESAGGARLELNMSKLPKGIYVLKFETSTDTFVKRMILE